ncbi:DUF4271 domain-containing protein [Anseongella ginsenosidimutans]|nr:DUF4271 domain-containing protein [Anseongella ginsenosidimutans]
MMRIALIFLLLCSLQPALSQTGPRHIYVKPDTLLQGPAPTDTAKNAVNSFLREFYRDYYTDFDRLRIPGSLPEERVIPNLDFRQREVRPAWQLLVLGALAMLAAILVRFFRRDLRDMFEGFISNRLINQAIREPGMLNTPAAFVLLLFGGLSIGALLYFIIPPEMLLFPYRGPELYFLFSGLTVLVYLARIFLLRMTGFIFGLREFVNSYLYILYTATGTISFLVLFFVLTRLLAPPSLAELAVPGMQLIFLLFFVYQYTRGIWYLVNTFQFPKIYLILYLCAFEICPLLILGMGLFNS